MLLGMVSVALPTATALIMWAIAVARNDSPHWASWLLVFLLMASSVAVAAVAMVLKPSGNLIWRGWLSSDASQDWETG